MAKKAYIVAVGSGMTGSAVNAVSALLLIWLLNQVLGKDGFGTIILSLVVLDTLTSILSSGFVSVILYRLSRISHEDSSQQLLLRSMLGTVTLYGSLVASAFAIGIALLAETIADLFDQPELAFWLRAMAIVIPLDAARRMLVEGCRAQQRVHLAVIYTDVLPGLLKLTGVGIVFVLSLPTPNVVYAYIMAQALSVIGLFVILRPRMAFSSNAFGASDYSYGMKLMLNRLANEPSRTIDVMIIGALSSAGVTAEYAVGSRLSKMLVVVKTAFARLLVPRLGQGMEKKDRTQIGQEYHFARLYSLIATIAGCTGICALGPYILPLFGDYDAAFPILMILAAAMAVRVGVGSSGGYLNMAGYAGFTLLSTVLGMGVNIIFAIVLVPKLAGVGGALSVLLATVVVQSAIGIFLWLKERFSVIDLASAITVACTVFASLLVAFTPVSHVIVTGILACVTVAYVLANRSEWLPLLPWRQ